MNDLSSPEHHFRLSRSPNDDLQCLTAQLVRRLDQALSTVGAFGEVRLIVVKGRVRFIEIVHSEDVNTI
jgi:hypothetical protein